MSGAKTFAYSYHAGGVMSKVQYPSGRWVSYDVNGANRVKAVRNGQTGTSFYLQGAAYRAGGMMAGAMLGLDASNQWTQSWDYNSSQQAQKLRVKKGSQALLGLDWIHGSNATYDAAKDLWVESTADNNGNLRTEKLSPLSAGAADRVFTYDAGNRVSSYSEPGKSQSFGYL